MGAPLQSSFAPVEHYQPMLSLESKVEFAVVADLFKRLEQMPRHKGADAFGPAQDRRPVRGAGLSGRGFSA